MERYKILVLDKRSIVKSILVTFLIAILFAIVLPAESSEEVKVKVYTDPDETIGVEVGAEFVIALESDEIGGYRWKFAKTVDITILEFKGTEYKESKTENNQELWTFKAIGRGTGMIVLKYVRVLEKDMYPLKSRTFIVDVK